MAEREQHKAKKGAVAQRKPSVKAPVVAARGTAAGPRATAGASNGDPAIRIAALEAERDRLRAELDAARRRIMALEEARDQALNRIAWVIDSLHTLDHE